MLGFAHCIDPALGVPTYYQWGVQPEFRGLGRRRE